MTVAEAARAAGTCRETVLDAVRSGLVRARWEKHPRGAGRRYRLDREDVADWVEARRMRPGDLLRDEVLAALRRLEPARSGEIAEEVRGSYGSVSQRSVIRALVELEGEGLATRDSAGYHAMRWSSIRPRAGRPPRSADPS